MSVVIDASMTLAWYFKDETTPVTDAVLEFVADHGALVPLLWRLEVANVLNLGIRRKRIDTEFRAQALAALAELPIFIDQDGDEQIWTRALTFSDRYGLTIYDACYFELAERYKMPLATLDRELIASARAHGLILLTV